MQEDEGDEDGDTPHAPGAGAILAQRSARQTADGPESPQLQASPLRAAGSAALGSMALDADAEVEHFKRMQVCSPWPPSKAACDDHEANSIEEVAPQSSGRCRCFASGLCRQGQAVACNENVGPLMWGSRQFLTDVRCG